MQAFILLFDIGNTSIKVGIAREEAVIASYTLRTDAGQTADSLGLTLYTLLQHAGHTKRITACVASSVVPTMTPLVREACKRFVGAPFFEAPKDIPIALTNCYDRPSEVGADRLVSAYAAREIFTEPTSLIVIDFGTATTFDCVQHRSYLGGLIFPGVHTAAAALSANAAKLPRIDLECYDLEPVPGRDTVSSIKHGIVFGFACMVEGLTARLAKQLEGSVHIIATGGFAKDIARISKCFHEVVPDLILDGLRQLYYKQNGNNAISEE